MNTPVADFIDGYLADSPHRLHMPGHKGQGDYARDITEIPGADVLYHARGILRESQENAAKLFGSRKTLYSAEGSSLSIRAMLYLVQLVSGPGCTILAARNAHKTFVTAAALLGITVQWLWPEDATLLSCPIDPRALGEYLDKTPVSAVYITSPDYLGNLAPIGALARVCHAHGTPLLVDNAHGAYLAFAGDGMHPIAQGADLCCDSAHKTLPVLTGGGYLHIGANAPSQWDAWAETAMSLFASTSPSYLILESLDRVNPWLQTQARPLLADLIPRLDALRRKLQEKGYGLLGQEPMKLTIAPKPLGYTGTALAEYLRQQRIEPEFFDPDWVVLMPGIQTEPQTLDALEAALLALPAKAALVDTPPRLSPPVAAMSMIDAIRRPGVNLPLAQALGKVLATPTVMCPPAVPVLVCGEVVNESSLEVLRYYGIETLNVLEESAWNL